MLDYADLLAFLRRPDADVRMAVRVGSHVYGTAHAHSDEDFVVVLRGDAKRDLLLGPAVNVTIQSEATFQSSLDEQSLFALECHFAPGPHCLKEGAPFRWKVEARGIRRAVGARARADFDKAMRTMADEPERARKRLFHAFRVPTFALQVLREGRIVDFAAANLVYEDVSTDPSTDPEHYAAAWRPPFEALLAALDG